MKKLYIFENRHALDLEPISITRPTFDLRCGAFTMLDRIRKMKPDWDVSLFVRDKIASATKENYPALTINPDVVEVGIWLLGNVLWQKEQLDEIEASANTVFSDQTGTLIAANLSSETGNQWLEAGGALAEVNPETKTIKELSVLELRFLWDFIQAIPDAVQCDKKYFERCDLSAHQNWINPDQIYLSSPELVSPHVMIDASSGPVIIDENVTLSSFTYLQGPLYIGNNTVVQPHSQVKQCIIGPQCRIAGELSKVIIQGFSNKAHYGFLGDSYLGEWVNLGAGTTNSNLKNNYETVSVQVNGRNIDTNSLFIGSFIGDHSKTAIGTLLNTGTVIGPGCNIISNGFPLRYIPALHWYLNGKLKKVSLEPFIKTAEKVKLRREKILSNAEKQLFADINRNNK